LYHCLWLSTAHGGDVTPDPAARTIGSAAMLCAVVQPPEMQYPPAIPYPAALVEFQRAVVEHPLAAWTREMYRRHRGASAETARA